MELMLILFGLACILAWAHSKRLHPDAPKKKLADRPQRQLAVAVPEDDSFLDGLEQQHNHAAERAIAHASAGESSAALRWYTEAATLAETLYQATGDKLWRTSSRNSRDLATQHARVNTKTVRTAPAFAPRTAPVAAPIPTIQSDPANERETLIGKFMRQHKFDRAMAENVVDNYLASRVKTA